MKTHVFIYLLVQQTQNIYITFIQCWTNVEDVGPTLYKYYTNVVCLLGEVRIAARLIKLKKI